MKKKVTTHLVNADSRLTPKPRTECGKNLSLTTPVAKDPFSCTCKKCRKQAMKE